MPAQRLSPDTRVNCDVGLHGDDAGESLSALAGRFRVDLSDFNFEDYFQPECGTGDGAWIFLLPFVAVFWLIDRLLGIHRKPRREPLTIGDLVEAARAGRWVK